VWASDFPHADHTADFGAELAELAARMNAETRSAFLGRNAARIFGLS
jgi:predicted TIM-barrel fold metal-dependent hydrolase